MHCVFQRTGDTEQSWHLGAVFELVSPVFIPSSTNRRVDLFASFASYAYDSAFAGWNFLLPAITKNNNAANFLVSLKQNNSEK